MQQEKNVNSQFNVGYTMKNSEAPVNIFIYVSSRISPIQNKKTSSSNHSWHAVNDQLFVLHYYFMLFVFAGGDYLWMYK